jgi:hypothetical protein
VGAAQWGHTDYLEGCRVEPRKLRGLCVLDERILAVGSQEVTGIKSVMTIMDAREVWSSELYQSGIGSSNPS